MKIRVVCFGAAREYLPKGTDGNSTQLELPSGATAAGVVDALGAPRRLIFSLLIDGVHGDLDTPLRDGVEVTLMPPFSGGD